jgi:hypothetical protein
VTTWFASETVRGKRKTGRLLVRRTDNKEFVLLPAGKSDEIYAEILAAGDVEILRVG